MRIYQYILVILATLFVNSAYAELYVEVGFEGGGEEAAATTTGDSISLGGGFKGAIGLQNTIGDGSSSFRLSVGYMFDSIDAVNGTADISTMTLDGVYLINSGSHSIGAGATMHMGPEYTEDSVFGSGTVEFDDAVGLVLQYGFHFSGGAELGVRYTDITYEVNGLELDAASLGLFLSNGF